MVMGLGLAAVPVYGYDSIMERSQLYGYGILPFTYHTHTVHPYYGNIDS